MGSNKGHKIKCLGVRGNILTDAGFQEFFQSLNKNESAKLQSLLFRKNHYNRLFFERNLETATAYNKDMFLDLWKESDRFRLDKDSRMLKIIAKLGGTNKDLSEEKLIEHFSKHKMGAIVSVKKREMKEKKDKKKLIMWFVEFANSLCVDKTFFALSGMREPDDLLRRFIID